MNTDSKISENLHIEIFDLEKQNLETSVKTPDFLQEKHFSPLDPDLDKILNNTPTENELEEKFNIPPALEHEVSLLPKPEFLEEDEIAELDAFAQWNNNLDKIEADIDEKKSDDPNIITEHPDISLNSHENVLKESEDMLNKISDLSAQNDKLDYMLDQFDIEVNQLEQNLEELKGTLASFSQGLTSPPAFSSLNNDIDQIFADFDKEVHQVFQEIPLEEINISYKESDLTTDDSFAKQIDTIISPEVDDSNFLTPPTLEISDYNINNPVLSAQDEIDHLTNFIPKEEEENKISLNLSEFNNIIIEEPTLEETNQKTIEINDINTSKTAISQEKTISEDLLISLNNNIPMSSSPFTTLSKEEFTQVLKELDILLEFLPDSKIEELIDKDFYYLYIRLMDELGI